MGSGVAIGVALTGGASAATAPAAAAARAHKCARMESRAVRTHPAAARAIRGICHSPLRLAFGRDIHGQITYKAKSGFRTLAFEQGTLESVSGSTLTVRAADGTTWIWHLVANSAITERGQQVAASKLAKGEQVVVAGPVVSSANNARLVRIRAAS